MKQPLTRSRSDKFIAGVCGGLARSFGIDAGLVRIITVVVALFSGAGIVAYLVAWAVLPLEAGGPTGIDEVKKMFGGGDRPTGNGMPNGDDLR
jgi:phage shock protein C